MIFEQKYIILKKSSDEVLLRTQDGHLFFVEDPYQALYEKHVIMFSICEFIALKSIFDSEIEIRLK